MNKLLNQAAVAAGDEAGAITDKDACGLAGGGGRIGQRGRHANVGADDVGSLDTLGSDELGEKLGLACERHPLFTALAPTKAWQVVGHELKVTAKRLPD